MPRLYIRAFGLLWMIAGHVFFSASFAMDASPWTKAYLRAGDDLGKDVQDAVQQSSRSFDSTLRTSLGHYPVSSERITLPSIASSSSRLTAISGLAHTLAEEAQQLARFKQRYALLEDVEYLLDEKTRLLIAMSIYPSSMETNDYAYSIIEACQKAQSMGFLYHLKGDYLLSKVAEPYEALSAMVPFIPSDARHGLILVWKKDSHLVQSNLRLLGVIHLSDIRDQPAIFSGLNIYELPRYDISRSQELFQEDVEEHLPSPDIAGNGIHRLASDETGSKSASSAQETESLRQLVERMLATSNIPRNRHSDVVLTYKTRLPPSSFEKFREMVLGHLGRTAKHFYQVEDHLVATKLDLTADDLSSWTGTPGNGFGLVFWQVDDSWKKLSFHGLVTITSHSLLVRSLENLARYTFLRPSSVQVNQDRFIEGQLRLVKAGRDTS